MDIQTFIDQNRDRFIKELSDILRISSISTDEKYKSSITQAAEWVKAKAEAIGFTKVQLLLPEKRKEGNPIVIGEYITDTKLPILTIYGHYDVQPVDPESEWTNKPFEPEIRDGFIYARGATDNKGQFYTNLAAAEYYIKYVKEKRFNIKLFIEGEEETSGETADAAVEDPANKELLKTDYLYISDGPWVNRETPSIEYSLRGLIYFDLHLRTSSRDMHSGLYGNVVMNPGNLAAYIIYKMKDIRKNTIRVPQFYKAVRKPSREEFTQLNKVSTTWEAIKEESGSKAVTKYLRKNEEFSPLTLTGLRPSFDVHGIETGYREWGKSKTVIASTASIKFSLRLVAYQDTTKSAELVRKYIMKIMPKGVEWDLQLLSSSKPYLTEPNDPEMKKLLKAFEIGFGKKAYMTTSGGSIGVVNTFKESLGTIALFGNYGFPEDGMHAPNECFAISQIEGGIKTFVAFLENSEH